MKQQPSSIILFDGVCNLCNGLVQFIIKHDHKARFTMGSLQSEGGQNLLRKYNFPLDDFDTFIYIKEEKVLVKSTGALHVLKDLGGVWKFMYVFIIIPRSLRDSLYSLIASNRYRLFGRQESCMLPDPHLSKRFLT